MFLPLVLRSIIVRDVRPVCGAIDMVVIRSEEVLEARKPLEPLIITYIADLDHYGVLTLFRNYATLAVQV